MSPERRIRRPATGGYHHTFSAAKFERIPGVSEALSWLLGDGDHRLRAKRVLLRARLKGILFRREHSWHVSGSKLALAIERAELREGPPIFQSVYGLGELCARASDPPNLSFRSFRRLSTSKAKKLMRVATQLALRKIPARKVVEIGTRVALMEPRLKNETMSHASAILRHPPLSRVGLYGLSAVIGLTLRLRPQVVGQWISRGQPAEINQTLLSHIARRLTFAHPEDPIHSQALSSRVPLLQAMAAKSLVEEHSRNKPAKTFPNLIELLQNAGLPEDIVFALALVSTRATINWRAQARGSVIQALRQQDVIRRNPANIAERAGHATERLDPLRNDLPTLQREQEAAELAVDELVTAIAETCPQDELSEEVGGILRSALGREMPELATRIAQKSTNAKARERLLRYVIENMSECLGMDTPTGLLDTRFNPDLLDYPSLCDWTARAYGLQYQDHPRGVGHHTAIALAKLARASTQVLESPYAAHRWPERYESALTRFACSVWFALIVANGENPDERASRLRLMHVALGQAAIVFRRDRVDMDTKGWTVNLAYIAVRIAPRSNSQDPREAWSKDKNLPAYVRALAVWSSLNLIQSNPTDAQHLFVEAGRHRAKSFEPGRGFQLMLFLLDLAIANCAGKGSDYIEQIILNAWPHVFNSWRHDVDGCFEHIHMELLEATRTDGTARQRLLVDPAWSGSAFVEAIRQANEVE